MSTTDYQRWAGKKASPLVLDLDNDGVELYAKGAYGSFFDLRGNGQAVLTGWVAPDDGLLAHDANGDGQINGVGELFGNATTDGFTQLAQHDGNDDGVIDSQDSIWSGLQVWTDSNSDGVSQSGELRSLGDLNISAISLDAVREAKREIAGNDITHSASFTRNGQQQDIVDAWFSFDPQHTRNVESVDLDVRTAYLPTAKGYGDLKDLHIAASQDNDETDANSLMSRLIDLQDTTSFADSLTNWSSLESEVEGLLFRWAGVEGVASSSRGEFVNGQQLAFYEAFRGRDFSQYGRDNPLPEAGEFAGAVFDYLKTFHSIQLLAQIDGGAIFTDNNYSLRGGGTTGDLSLRQSGIDAVETAAANASDGAGVWTHFAQFLGYTKGLDDLTSSEISALDTAVANSGVSGLSNWSDVTSAMQAELGEIVEAASDWSSFNASYDNLQTGSSGDDTLTDSTTSGAIDNELRGGDGNDLVQGLNGHDKLKGGTGADTLEGGTGDDYLLGGPGDDIYLYESGNDTIAEQGDGGTDELHFMASTGITESNITDMYRQGEELLLFVDNGDYITIDGYQQSGSRIETIKFLDDGSQIDLTALTEQEFRGTPQADDLNLSGTNAQTYTVKGKGGNDEIEVTTAAGKLYGGAGLDTLIGDTQPDILHGEGNDDLLLGYTDADTLYGNAGDDALRGGAGNDTLKGGDGSDTLDGGAGDDTLIGNDFMAGNGEVDTFIYGTGYGDDTVESASFSNAEIQFSNLTPSDINLQRFDNATFNEWDFVFQVDASGNTLTLHRAFQEDYYNPDEFEFADGTTWSSATLRQNYFDAHTTSGDDSLIGFDYLDDTFESTSGDDYLAGYGGDDTYKWGANSGNDTIFDEDGSATSRDEVVFEALNYQELNYAFTGNDLVLSNPAAGNTLTVEEFASIGDSEEVELFSFANGETYSETAIKATVEDGTVITETGSTGDDVIQASSGAADVIFGNYGDDEIHGDDGDDDIRGEDGNDTLYGDAGNDELHGGDGDDELNGGAGDDMFYEDGYGADVINGGAGEDTVSYESWPHTFDISLPDNVADGETIKNIENVYGSERDNTITGDAGNNDLYGLGFDDTLIGGEGDDLLDGGEDEDTADYSASPNAITADLDAGTATGNGSDTLTSIENLVGSAQGDTFTAHGGGSTDNDYQGNGGTDTLSYSAAASAVTIDHAAGTASGAGSDTFSGIENITGSANNDTIIAKDGGTNVYAAGGGTDTLDYSGHSTAVYATMLDNKADDNWDGSTASFDDDIYSFETIIGSAYDDKLRGDNGVDETIKGGAGNDSIRGQTGDDTLYGGAGDDNILGDGGNDEIYGDGGADKLIGGSDQDTLYGDSGADHLKGRDGDDMLVGGAGSDTLRGGGGADTFKWKSGTIANDVDTVEDFDAAENDVLDISDILAGFDDQSDDITDFLNFQAPDSNNDVAMEVDKDGTGSNHSFVKVAAANDQSSGLDAQTLYDNGNVIA